MNESNASYVQNALDHLTSTCSWVAWSYEQRGENVTKPPIAPRTGNRASVAESTTWGTYEEALARKETDGLAGIGIVLTGAEGIIGIDIDDCIDDSGVVKSAIQRIVDLRETYAERSPSGKGIRMFALGTLERAYKSDRSGIELYDRGRYLTFTGMKLDECPDVIQKAPETLKRLLSVIETEKARNVAVAKEKVREPTQKPTRSDFIRDVNDAALVNLDIWVPQLLPAAKQSALGYRVSSFDLGRDLEEDLSITSDGIKDWGTADVDDAREGNRTPIDLVIEYGDNIDLVMVPEHKDMTDDESKRANGKNCRRAALWLCEQLGIDTVAITERVSDYDIILDAFNEKYCVVIDGGRTQVLSFKETEIGTTSRYEAEYQSFEDFKKFYQNRMIKVPRLVESERDGKRSQTTEVVTLPAGRWWLDHPDRRQHTGIVFAPNKPRIIDSKLNLWRGFAVQPIAGDWSLMKEHIRVVLADGNEEYAAYIINWCAWAIQNPHIPAEAALVIQGGKGTGKGTLGNSMMKLFGQHGIQISSVQQLVGNFNGHLRDACFVFCDEALWGGDKVNDGQIKRLITEPTLQIERKNKDAQTCTNMLHVMMAGNEKWLVPASSEERRYAVFKVSDAKQQDSTWFTPLHDELRSGGLEAMLYEMLNMDLNGFHPRQVIKTDALLAQQEEGFSPIESWYQSVLEYGMIPGSFSDNPTFSATKSLIKDVWDSSTRLKGYFSEKKLVGFLREHGCQTSRPRNIRGVLFPPLAEAREDWEKKYPGTVWEEPELTEWEPENQSNGSEFGGPLGNAGIRRS